MTYSLNLNQIKMIEWGLSIKAGILMCKMVTLSTWATAIKIEDDIYYVLYRSKIKEELPILGNSTTTITKYLSELIEKELVLRVNENSEPAYKLTEKGKEWLSTTSNTNDAESSKEKQKKDILSLKVEVPLEDVSDEYKQELHRRCFEYCKKNNIKYSEMKSFANWHLAKGTAYKNWYRAFITWCSRDTKLKKKNSNGAEYNKRGDLTGMEDNF